MIDYNEIVDNPLLREVVFEARFPILLKIPRDIADFQEAIIDKFPETNIIYDKKIFFDSKEGSEEISEKACEFVNPENQTKCQVFNHKYSLFSNAYKSWKGFESKEGFHDVLKLSMDNFIKIFGIKKFNRLGLRYINKFELEENSSEMFKKYFIPLFNYDKYKVENLSQNSIRLRVKKPNSIELTIMGVFVKEDNKDYYILDFDAFSLNIVQGDLYNTLEKLHDILLKEFHSLITEDCRKKMRGEI